MGPISFFVRIDKRSDHKSKRLRNILLTVCFFYQARFRG